MQLHRPLRRRVGLCGNIHMLLPFGSASISLLTSGVVCLGEETSAVAVLTGDTTECTRETLSLACLEARWMLVIVSEHRAGMMLQ